MKLNQFLYVCESEIASIQKKNCSVVTVKGKKLKVILSKNPTLKKCSKSDPLVGIVTEKKCINIGSSKKSLDESGDSLNDILNNRKFSVTDPSRTH